VVVHQERAAKQIVSDFINVLNVCVEGKWPALWLAKLELFVRAVGGGHTPGKVAVWWDEDDMFEPTYTMQAVLPIKRKSAVGTWTDKTFYVKKGAIVSGTYPRSNGTLAIKVEALKAVVPEVRKIHPEGHRVKRGMVLTVDPTLIKVLGKRYGDKMMDHTGMRYYFLRSGGNGGPRRVGTGVNIDE